MTRALPSSRWRAWRRPRLFPWRAWGSGCLSWVSGGSEVAPSGGAGGVPAELELDREGERVRRRDAGPRRQLAEIARGGIEHVVQAARRRVLEPGELGLPRDGRGARRGHAA